jgi:hypothetical protein
MFLILSAHVLEFTRYVRLNRFAYQVRQYPLIEAFTFLTHLKKTSILKEK